MDPKACLDRMERAINEGDFDEADEAGNDYFSWRVNGGFTYDADARYKALLVRFNEKTF